MLPCLTSPSLRCPPDLSPPAHPPPPAAFQHDTKRALQGLVLPLALMAAGLGWQWYAHTIMPLWQQVRARDRACSGGLCAIHDCRGGGVRAKPCQCCLPQSLRPGCIRSPAPSQPPEPLHQRTARHTMIDPSTSTARRCASGSLWAPAMRGCSAWGTSARAAACCPSTQCHRCVPVRVCRRGNGLSCAHAVLLYAPPAGGGAQAYL